MGNHDSKAGVPDGQRFFTKRRNSTDSGKNTGQLAPSVITLSVADSECSEMMEKQPNHGASRNLNVNHANTSDGESPDSTQIDEDIDSLFSYLNGWLDDDLEDIGQPEEKKNTLSSVPEVDENDEDYSDMDSYPPNRNHVDSLVGKIQERIAAESTREPLYTPIIKPPRKNKVNNGIPLKKTKWEEEATLNQEIQLAKTFQKEEDSRNIYARIKELEMDSNLKRGDEKNGRMNLNPNPQYKSSSFIENGRLDDFQDDKYLSSNRVAARSGVVNPANAVYRRPSFKALPKSETDRILEEGTIVQSIFSFSNPMPGTLSFTTGQTGMVMRRNAGGWCYICLRNGEGWAPADYWQTVPVNLEDQVLANKDWFFGFVSRPDCEFLLLKFGDEGDFLIRNSTVRQNEFTLSLRHRDSVHHFAVRKEGSRCFYIGKLSYRFESLDAIIFHYQQHTILSDTVALLEKPFSFQF